MIKPININPFNEAKEFIVKCENKNCILFNREKKVFLYQGEGKSKRPRFIDIKSKELKYLSCEKCGVPFKNK